MADEKKEAPVESTPDYGWPEVTHKNPMADKPVVAPDGHVVLSKEDIKSRA